MALVELKDVTVRYGDLTALDGISCSIENGAVGLLGPNGAGKSTLIKTLLGFNRAETGTVQVFGLDMPANALAVRQKLGYMPEREVTSPKVSAVSFLTYCGRLFGMSRVDAMERAHEVLNYVKLGEARYRKMETYSTGMLQRVKLAQALIHDPKLLLLDEPTNGLDPSGRIDMLELIREITHERHVGVILSSHLLPDVQHVCDTVVMIAQGKVVREGRIDAMTSAEEGAFEVRVRDDDERFTQQLESGGYTWTRQHDGTLLVVCSGSANGQGIFHAAQACGTQIRHYRPVRHSLEEVFLDAIGKK
jgi:ABC-2 type transport system ATP-binding protein